ncbi:MAG: hypothetical protein WC091_09610 [Sulfuricellaceae bacterium]
MQILSIGELKSHFSAVLLQVKNGETIVVSYGRNKEKVAAIVPYVQVMPQGERRLGLWKGKAQCIIGDDFAISDEDMLAA